MNDVIVIEVEHRLVTDEEFEELVNKKDNSLDDVPSTDQ